ncbi:MAG: DinB family protein [Anaerolineae bacterium]|nr:DinB family protein [Anaerolineae bacterium]
MSKRQVLLDALAATPADLERLVKGLDSAVLTQRPTSDEWSIADLLCHLALVEKLSLARLKLVVEGERPSISPIYPDPSLHDLNQSLTTMLANFRLARQTTLVYLQGLKAGDWQRTGIHPTRGSMNLRALVQFLVDHDTVHLNQIIETKTKHLTHADQPDNYRFFHP